MVRTVDVLTQGLAMPLDRVGRREEMRVTSILKRAGYESRHGRPGGWGQGAHVGVYAERLLAGPLPWTCS
ncbi:MAG TPA: hypothetical protein VJN18_12485 [Polyangiaceae bacterium]|nr:hypothetical protein [Polyangiaceae bacterium]